MDNAPVEKLREIINNHGRGIVVEPARCASLLRDYCGEHRREASVLIGALNEGIPSRLIQSETSAGTVTFDSLSNHLQQSVGFSDEAARWAVRAWSSALGIKERVSSSSGSPGVTPARPPQPVQLPFQPPVQMPLQPSFQSPAQPSFQQPDREADFRGYVPPPHPVPRPDPAIQSEDAELWVRRAWYAAIVSAAYSMMVALALIPTFYPAPWLYLASVQNSIAIIGLGFGVLQKNRLCAVLLLSYHLLGTMVTWMQFPNEVLYVFHKLAILVFLYFYGKGIQATFALHDLGLRRQV